MNMTVINNRPFTKTSDQVFIPCYLIPSTKYFADTMLSQSCESQKLKIQTEISEASISSDQFKDIIFFLTAHWLNESFEYKHLALHCKEIESSYTGFNISENIKEMLEN